MALETLAAAAIAMLTPYLAAGATKAAETLGEQLAGKTGTLLTKVREWFKGDERAAGALQQYEADPSLYEGVAEKLLAERIERDPAVREELQALLDGMGSRAVVVQKIVALAGSATGLDVGKVKRGLEAYAHQDVGKVEQGGKLTGIKINET